MTFNQAYQEFFDNAYHNSMKPDISDDAKVLAMVALIEKIERENPKPIPYKNLEEFVYRPVFIVYGGIKMWTVLNSVSETSAHFSQSSDFGVYLAKNRCGITWFAYEHEPKGV